VTEDVVCARCGAVAATPAAVRLTWSLDSSGQARQWYCPVCSREHVRSIEAKLDEEHWGPVDR
jgi:hypothetical protein